MSTSKKPLGKRKRQSPPPPTTSQISRRLEKLRSRNNNLWNDGDRENEEEEVVQNVQPKNKSKTPPDNTYIVLTDSDDENQQRRSKSKKSKKKSRIQDENLSSDNDTKMKSKCPTCLICSILSTLTSYNCCANHLSLLKYNQTSHHHRPQQKHTTNPNPWPPQQVMIVPVTDDLIQRFLNPQEIHRLRTRKLSKSSTHVETEEINSSSGTIPNDVTYTLVSSTSTTSNSFESPSDLNTGQLQQSSDQLILIDDSQPDSQQEKKKMNDPWTPISDETYAAIETALEQVEFTPALARRTPTDLMAARLPKIQLKKGRYHRGKPVADKSTTSITTNESSSSSSINTRSSPLLETIVEDEPVSIQSTCQILSERHDNTPRPLSDTVMSCLLAQDESSQTDIIHTTTKPIPNEALPALETIIEESARENESHKSTDMSQSSQLTNDQNDTNPLISSTTNENPTTPARISYRLNPDGSRVSLSRPASSIRLRSQPLPLRRASTGTTHTKK